MAKRSSVLALLLLLTMAGGSHAQPPPNAGPPPSSVMTPSGPAMITGSPGPMRPVMIPGSAAGGTLMDNGNGTNTIVVPGGAPIVVPSPR